MKKSTVLILSFFLASILFAAHLPAKERAIKVKLRQSERVNAPVVAEVDLYNGSYALVIGINNYTKGWPRLSGAVHDAELVAAVLKEKGFEVTFRKDLDSRELKQAFEEFFIFKGENPQARLFVWFAGHGHTLEGEGFLIPADAPRPGAGAQFKYKALSMRRFGEFVRLAKSKHALAVFDSCFSGTIFDTQRTAPPPAVTRATTLPVRQFLSSGDSNQKVSDDGRFRKLFVRAIRGEEMADANRDGYLTGSELGLFLTDRLTNLTQSRQTPRYGKLRDEDWDRGDFVFQLASSSGVTIEEQTPTSEGAILKVTSNVDRSAVLVDGVSKGTTPVTLKGLKTGRHRIKVTREGYEPYEERVFLRQGKRLIVKAILERPSGTIEVTGRPRGAKVYLDGYYTGGMPVEPTQVQPGPHIIKVVKKGFREVERTVNVEPGKGVRLKVDLRAVAKAVSEPKAFTNSLGMKFIKIPSGSFMMGSGISASEVENQYGGKEKWYKDEHPQHRVTISKPFYMQKMEVTVGQWRSFIQDTGYKTEAETGGGAYVWTGKKWEKKEGTYWDNPGFNQGDNNPVTCVSWNDVQEFIKWLNRKEGKEYRLPTEAEWEYGARAGSTTRFCYGNNKDGLAEYAWYWDNSGKRTHSVGEKKPNSWGLYDMHGNVYEWCRDWYGDYPPGSVTDPTGPSLGSYRVFRGGCWLYSAWFCRSAYRLRNTPGFRFNLLGFRLARRAGGSE